MARTRTSGPSFDTIVGPHACRGSKQQRVAGAIVTLNRTRAPENFMFSSAPKPQAPKSVIEQVRSSPYFLLGVNVALFSAAVAAILLPYAELIVPQI